MHHLREEDIYYTISPINGAVVPDIKRDQCCDKGDNTYLYIDDTIKSMAIELLLPRVKQGLPLLESQNMQDTNVLWVIKNVVQRICRDTKVLLRRYNFMLQEGINTYPVYSCENEVMHSMLNFTIAEFDHNHSNDYKHRHHHHNWWNAPANFNSSLNEIVISRNAWHDRYVKSKKYSATVLFSAMPEDNFCRVDENIIKNYAPDIVKIARSEVITTYYYDNIGLMRTVLPNTAIIQTLLRIQSQSRSITQQYIQNSTEGTLPARSLWGATYG